ncbi:MAG: glycosyltransferase family 4 protein [Elusimicrobia bacterium]|nr:glycosyltransferase family 4 protein [Elusimicrobiota bacterium]
MKRRLAIASRRVEGLSGAARMIIEHARRFVQAGWDVHVFAEKLDKKALVEAGVTPRWVPAWPWGSWLKRRAFAAAAGGMAKGFDLVHGHGDLLDQDVLSLHNCVHAAHEAVHGSPLPENDAVGRMHALQLSEQRFQVLVANSNLMKSDVIKRFGVPADKIEVVYPGYDSCRFNAGGREDFSAPMRAELGVKPGEVLYGLVTSGDFEKRGLPAFLRAFAKAGPNARALVVGKESRPGPYLALARELGIADRVVFREPMAEVWRFYHALDVYVHPARWEEFGMSVLEALACGLPVICGANVGAAELLNGDGREYVLSEPSGEPLAQAMSALADPGRRAALGALGPAAASSCVWDRGAASVAAVYDRLVVQ